MTPSLNTAVSTKALMAAWARVQINEGGPGTDRVTIAGFAQNASARIQRLRRQVLEGTYVPQPLRRVTMYRPGRRPRDLSIPSVRDRILQTSVAATLQLAIEPRFDDRSFGYRPGRSVIDAIEHVIKGRDRGFQWVVDADIHAFFDSIAHDVLIDRIRTRVADQALVSLIACWLTTPFIEAGQTRSNTCGIAQGSPLSPFLANLLLDGFDRSISSPEQWLVRYADDFLIQCIDHNTAEEALKSAARWLAEHGLKLAADKTRIISFSQGFEFLGVRFKGDTATACDPAAEAWVLPWRLRRHRNGAAGPRASKTRSVAGTPSGKPAEIEREGVERCALLRTLHLTEHGNYLHLKAGRLIVVRGAQPQLEVPIGTIDQVCATTEGAISFGALRTLLEHRIGFVLTTPGQRPGWLSGMDLGHLELQRAQFKREDDAGFRLDTARAIVRGKIANSRLVLRRYLRLRAERDTGADSALEALQRGAAQASGVDAVRGYEGQAAKRYFVGLAKLLPAAWELNGRNRRPPRDPVNALLSYGYAILFHNVLTLIVRKGLNPCLGTLHAARNGHAALASDLMEEFRPLIVDSVVLRALLGGDISHDDFSTPEGSPSIQLTQPARRRFVTALENKLNSPIMHPSNGQLIDFRRVIEWQVGHYADVLTGRLDRYTAFTRR